MCGLVGVMSSNMIMKHRDVLTSLLYLDTWRGRDSTGVAAIRANHDTAILKQTVPGYDFVEGPKLEQFLKFNDWLWIGHNRFGTVGKNIKSNAHPFEILDEDGACMLVGAHNGTLKNKYSLKDHLQFGTDSEALYWNIANSSIEEVIPQVEGAWALTYYDHFEEELRFLRNDERPLFFAFEEGMKTIVWASEQWMIRIAMTRSGLKIAEDKIHTVEVDTLYKFPIPKKMNDQLTFEKQGGLVGKKTATFFQGTQRERWTGGPVANHGGTQPQTAQTPQKATTTCKVLPVNQTTPNTSTPSGTTQPRLGGTLTPVKSGSSSNQSSAPDGSSNVVSLEQKTFKGYLGATLSLAQLRDDLSGGCAWCETESIKPTDRYAWLDSGKPVCSTCLDGLHEETDFLHPSVGVSVH